MVMLMPIWAEWWKAISRVSWEDVNYNDDDDDDEGDGDDFGENSSRLLWMETIRLNSELKSPKILECTFA